MSIDVAGERFSASGLMITARNYLEVYPYDKWSSKEIHVYQVSTIYLLDLKELLGSSEAKTRYTLQLFAMMQTNVRASYALLHGYIFNTI